MKDKLFAEGKEKESLKELKNKTRKDTHMETEKTHRKRDLEQQRGQQRHT